MPIQDSSFFDTTNLYKKCASSQEPLLQSLSFRLNEAWNSLINNDEAEPLMCEVNLLIDEFELKRQYPSFTEVGVLLSRAYRDYYRQTVKWASVYAGLAAIVESHENTSDAKHLIACSALVLYQNYRPCTEEAYNNYVSRKGGAARKAQRQPLKDELRSLPDCRERTRRSTP